MCGYVPRRWPAYTVDDSGAIRAYWGPDAWLILRGPSERRVFKKDLPRGFEPEEEYGDYDV